MNESRREAFPVLLVVAVLLLISLSLYVGTCFWLSDTITSIDGRQMIRAYRSEAIAALFHPAAIMESWI